MSFTEALANSMDQDETAWIYAGRKAKVLVFSCSRSNIRYRSKCKNVEYARGQFTYTVKNTIVRPTFFLSINMTIDTCNDTVLLKYMELACDEHKDIFKNFSQTYFSGIGYYVSAINGVSELPGESYWELIEHTTGHQYQVGVHHYIPQHGDHVAWNLTLIDSTEYTTPAKPAQQTESSLMNFSGSL